MANKLWLDYSIESFNIHVREAAVCGCSMVFYVLATPNGACMQPYSASATNTLPYPTPNMDYQSMSRPITEGSRE
jgi:hypothetical protein